MIDLHPTGGALLEGARRLENQRKQTSGGWSADGLLDWPLTREIARLCLAPESSGVSCPKDPVALCSHFEPCEGGNFEFNCEMETSRNRHRGYDSGLRACYSRSIALVGMPYPFYFAVTPRPNSGYLVDNQQNPFFYVKFGDGDFNDRVKTYRTHNPDIQGETNRTFPDATTVSINMKTGKTIEVQYGKNLEWQALKGTAGSTNTWSEWYKVVPGGDLNIDGLGAELIKIMQTLPGLDLSNQKTESEFTNDVRVLFGKCTITCRV